MKHWLLAMALICLGSISAVAANEVFDSYNSGCALSRIYVSSLTATSPSQMDPGDLDLSTGTANTQNTNNLQDNRRLIKVENQDRAGMPYRCDTSSTTLGASVSNYGSIVASSGTLTLNVPARDQDGNRLKLWCRSLGALVSTATVTQCNSR